MAILLRQKPDVLPSVFEKRLLILVGFIFVFGLIIILRLFSLQVLQNSFYLALASDKQEVYKNLFPVRGSIYTNEQGELYPLVTNRDYYLVFAEPVKIESPKKIVDSITPILDLKEEEWKDLLGRLAKTNDPYEPIKHKVTKQQMEQIKALNLTGIGFSPESYRFYPETGIGGHIFGFVSVENDKRIGQYGLEGYFNKELSGKSGLLKSVKDALGSLITIGPRSVQKAENGVDLVTTIDRHVQFTACQKLKHFYEYFKAESATVIIMEPRGAILAMCNFPDFDPDNYNAVEDINYLNNPAIFSDYEPGSVFKPITMAAALDTGKVSPDTTYEDTGEVKVGPFKIRNFDNKAHGVKTMTEVLEESLNTGAMFAAEKVGKETLRKYVNDFGFGKNTGITLDKEVPGDISQLDKKGDVYYLTASFGQGITITPLQLVAAYGAMANNGILSKPYIVSEIIKLDGTKEVIQPQTIRQVMAPKSAALLTGMLVSVTEKGYDKKAKVAGYYLAAKTGTAQVAGKNGGYSGKTIHTFIGYGPVSKPKFVMLLKLNNPQGIGFASDSLGPLFRQIAEFLLNYYQIPPDY
ncbi:MAG: penicillin-binding protein 2 [Patescibacteria group bacterium]|jgi:cell division protein FtsI/penicillin-binding protein 2